MHRPRPHGHIRRDRVAACQYDLPRSNALYPHVLPNSHPQPIERTPQMRSGPHTVNVDRMQKRLANRSVRAMPGNEAVSWTGSVPAPAGPLGGMCYAKHC